MQATDGGKQGKFAFKVSVGPTMDAGYGIFICRKEICSSFYNLVYVGLRLAQLAGFDDELLQNADIISTMVCLHLNLFLGILHSTCLQLRNRRGAPTEEELQFTDIISSRKKLIRVINT